MTSRCRQLPGDVFIWSVWQRDSAVTDRRQLRGHQERRSRAEVTTGQRVTGMLTGMSWAATTGASHHQQDNNKHQAGPRGAVTVDNRPGICREEEVVEGGCKRGHIHLLYTLSHISPYPYILLLYLISLTHINTKHLIWGVYHTVLCRLAAAPHHIHGSCDLLATKWFKNYIIWMNFIHLNSYYTKQIWQFLSFELKH